MNTQGMTEITLTNVETREQATYTVADIQAAQMLAAEDHGGEPEEWLTAEEIAAMENE